MFILSVEWFDSWLKSLGAMCFHVSYLTTLVEFERPGNCNIGRLVNQNLKRMGGGQTKCIQIFEEGGNIATNY